MAKTVKVVSEHDIGAGLAIEGGKLIAAIDGKTIVIEGDKLVAKTEAQVDLRVTAIVADKATGKLKITVADAEGGNATTVETSLADLIALSQEEGNLAEVKSDGIFVGKEKVKEAAKEVVDAEKAEIIAAAAAEGATSARREATVHFQSLGGETLGYAYETQEIPEVS